MKNKRARIIDKQEFLIETIEFPPVNGSPIIKVEHCGVCGSDLHFWNSGNEALGNNIVPGHEYTGVIVEPGNTDFKVGDRVIGYTQNPYNDPCGKCEACLKNNFDNCTGRKVKLALGSFPDHPGAYSEYITWYPRGVFKIPDGLASEDATLTEPLTVSLRAVLNADLKAGDKVLIIGGGMIGCGVAEWCRIFGAGTIAMTELNKEKISMMRDFGIADGVYEADAPALADQLKAVAPDGFDIVIDCLAFPDPINMGLELIKVFGTYVLVGLNLKRMASINIFHLQTKGVRFIGSKGHWPEIFKFVMDTIASGRINARKYITHRTTLDNIQNEFERMRREGNDFKVLIDF